jgi:hypothetical protein
MSDEILTSPSGQRMLSYVSPIYYQSRVMLAIFQTIGLEIDDLHEWVTEIREQLFPQTATWGLKYWEQVLGLPTNEAAPIGERRRAVLTKLATRTPVTPSLIKQIAQSNTGKPATVENRIGPYTFRIIMESDGTGVDLQRLNKAIDEAKPAHLTAEYGILYKGGINIKGEVPVIEQSPLVFAADNFLCGRYPEAYAIFAGYHIAEAYLQSNVYTKDYPLAGTFVCRDVFYPEAFVQEIAYHTVQAAEQLDEYTKEYRLAGTFYCGEGLL